MPTLLYENISNEIILQIKTGILKEGSKLSERSLAEKYGVSRTVIRDALKVLNEKGYVEIQPGKGHYVKLPSAHDIREKLGNVIANSTVPLNEIVEARIALEGAMVDLIVERVTAEDIAQLEAIYEQMSIVVKDREPYGELDKQFHIKLMECGKNEMLTNFIQILNDTLDRNYILWDLSVRIQAHDEHKEMLELLKAKNAKGLREALIRHIVVLKN